MKLLLSLLVVANVLLFGWFRGWMAPFGGDGRDPGRVQFQIESQQLRIVETSRPGVGVAGGSVSGEGRPGGADETGGAAAASPAPTVVTPNVPGPRVPSPGVPASGVPGPGVSGPNAQAPNAQAPNVQAPNVQAPNVQAPSPPAPSAPAPKAPALTPLGVALKTAACAEIGPMSEQDAVRVQVALDAVVRDLSVTTRRADDVTSWWVYVAPSQGDVAKRVADLRERGVSDLYVMTDGQWRGAISFGLFRQEELAVALQKTIAQRGVRNVRVAPRGPSPGRITLQVRPISDAVVAELSKLRAAMSEAIARPCWPRS